MSKRINIVLPDATIKVWIVSLPEANEAGSYPKPFRRSLREQLKAGYQANTARNLAIAAEWFPLEEEAWRKGKR